MRSIILSALVVVLLAFCGCQPGALEAKSEHTPSPSYNNDTSAELSSDMDVPILGDGSACTISLGMSQDEVKEVLSTAELSFSISEEKSIIYTNDKKYSCTIGLLDGKAFSVEIMNDVVKTSNGIGCGNSSGQILKQYGPPQNVQVEIEHNGVETYEYLSKGINLSFTIDTKKDVVVWWKIAYDIPETRLKLTGKDGQSIYLYLGIPDEELQSRVLKTEYSFIEGNDGKLLQSDMFTLCLASTPGDPYYLLYQYIVNKAGYPTSKGIEVGDTRNTLLSVYGNPDYTSETNGVYNYEYKYILKDEKEVTLGFTVDAQTETVLNWYSTRGVMLETAN